MVPFEAFSTDLSTFHLLLGDSSLEETLSSSRLIIQIACTMLAFESSSFNFALVWVRDFLKEGRNYKHLFSSQNLFLIK